jgi:hypothetical protein
VAKLISLLLCRVRDADADDDMAAWILQLRAVMAKCSARIGLSGPQEDRRDLQLINRELDRADAKVHATEQQQAHLQLARDKARLHEQRRTRQSTRREELSIASREQELAGPGGVRPQGPRHDNDHEDIREISVVPTQAEVLCAVSPFLPRPGGTVTRAHPFSRILLYTILPSGSGHVFDPTERRLDVLYRQYREDLLLPLRETTIAMLAQRVRIFAQLRHDGVRAKVT